jgi:hypothetical protein
VQIINVLWSTGDIAVAGVGVTKRDAISGKRRKQANFFTDFSLSP